MGIETILREIDAQADRILREAHRRKSDARSKAALARPRPAAPPDDYPRTSRDMPPSVPVTDGPEARPPTAWERGRPYPIRLSTELGDAAARAEPVAREPTYQQRVKRLRSAALRADVRELLNEENLRTLGMVCGRLAGRLRQRLGLD